MKIAIIFASGVGKRLKPLTNEIHKSLIKINGVPLIEHIITNLLAVKDLKNIIIVTGYRQQDFYYLTSKYHHLTLINNPEYLAYPSAYALSVVKKYFTKDNDIFIVSGDFIMQENCFLSPITTNVMAAMVRKQPKLDWSYQLNHNGNIIDIVKSNDISYLLSSEWTHITGKWAQLIGNDLNNEATIKTLKTNIMGKYLVANSLKNHINLKPYLLDFDKFWDLDTLNDLQRINDNFK